MILRTLTPILSIIIAVLLVIFFVHPKYIEITAIQNEIDEYNTAIDRYNEFSATLDNKLAIKKGRSAYDNERLDQIVPETEDNAQLLVDLKSLAEQFNLLFGNISVAGKGDDLKSGAVSATAPEDFSGELTSQDISFEVIGTYEQIKAFITDLEKSLTLFEITSLSMDASKTIFQQASVTVRVYSLQSR